MQTCTWCDVEIKGIKHCDYWDSETHQWMLMLCKECAELRFNYAHKVQLVIGAMNMAIRDLEKYSSLNAGPWVKEEREKVRREHQEEKAKADGHVVIDTQ